MRPVSIDPNCMLKRFIHELRTDLDTQIAAGVFGLCLLYLLLIVYLPDFWWLVFVPMLLLIYIIGRGGVKF
jgi:hypothetical protein